MQLQVNKHRWISTAGCVAFGIVVSTANAWADDLLATASSPGKVLDVSVQVAKDGRLAYQVSRHGKPVISSSRLGFVLANGAPLDAGFRIARQQVTMHDDTWEQPWGERRFVRNHYTQLRVDVRQKDAAGRRLAIVFRVFDDGVGFRYEFPKQAHMKAIHISDELTEFVVAQPAEAWWQPAGEVMALEYPIRKTALGEVGMANTPLTVRTDDGIHIAFHEAALVDYASMWLRRVEGQKLRAHLTPSTSGPAVVHKGAFNTPWRTMQIADDAPGLYMSDLVLNLNEPNQLGDVSWVKPSKFVGVWWEMHLERSTWSSGPRHGATTANTRRHIDFAARHGLRGVLVEGWNLGWDENWAGSGSTFSFTQPYPDFDLPGLAAYARERGVRLVGHHETGGNIARYESQMDAAYQLYARLGVDTIKSGYVADAGGAQFAGPGGKVHYGYTDGQEGVRHFVKAVTEAAKYKLSIDTHEPVKDTGLRRTYPNWLSREGARGMEFNAWGNPVNSVNHEASLVFTRMLSGPMDYTPGILSLQGLDGRWFNSTQAKQLANFVVIYSPVVMAADLIENYDRYPQAFKFIKDVPTDWADTRVLNGAVGAYATIARKDRASDDWYVGAVTDGFARVLPLPLDFLDADKSYIAEIYRDGDQADYRNDHRFDLVTEQRTVTSKDKLTLRLAPGGGQAIRFTPKAAPRP
ncbi:glycoside hydrolase family 97 protein [Duganella sp. FT27W]|uniref:glycoside hydrolase family 97 protein n=1 Tax=Duganella sp. FT27W TaxID=2654636 RepID=UPI00128B2AD1|nr:glycoside hydrolase family 97 protein [Duganella sp. FT27W]MPQ55486.1 glycoside hydrolase family 97 protein [Duganella sp. FT27W]